VSWGLRANCFLSKVAGELTSIWVLYTVLYPVPAKLNTGETL